MDAYTELRETARKKLDRQEKLASLDTFYLIDELSKRMEAYKDDFMFNIICDRRIDNKQLLQDLENKLKLIKKRYQRTLTKIVRSYD